MIGPAALARGPSVLPGPLYVRRTRTGRCLFVRMSGHALLGSNRPGNLFSDRVIVWPRISVQQFSYLHSRPVRA